MSHFEEYKKAKKQELENPQAMVQYRESVQGRGFTMPGPENHEIDYDADQLMEYFEDRNKSKEDFEARTDYYFKDALLGASKQQQYQRYANDENGITSAYSRSYGNHYAWKRKSNASNAAKNFRIMNEKMARYAQDDEQNVDNYTKYLHREEIMKYRLKGMIAAAETKSKNKVHESYLKGRAKLSCNMLLKDQLLNLIQKENDDLLKGRLQDKLNGVERKIKDAYDEIKNSSPSVQESWREVHGINKRTISEKQSEYRDTCGVFSSDATNMLLNLEMIQGQVRSEKIQWPCRIVLKDKADGPLNRAKIKNKKFNQSYSKAKQDDDQEALKRMEEEGIERFMKMHIPTPNELTGDSLVKFITGHLREYYEMTKLALPYYQNKVFGEDGSLREYALSHQDFLRRLFYVEAVNKYIDFTLRHDHLIMYDGMGRFKIEGDPRYRFARRRDNGDWARQQRFGEGEDMREFGKLTNAFRKYSSGGTVRLREKRNNINLINDNLIIKDEKKNDLINDQEDEKFDKVQVTGKVTEKFDKVKVMGDVTERKEDKKEVKKEDKPVNIMNEEEDGLEPLDINQIIKERETEDEKRRKEKRQKFENRKEADDKYINKINDEDIKEDRKKNKKEDKKKDQKKEQIQKEDNADKNIINIESKENQNRINIIHEEEDEVELNKEEEKEYIKIRSKYSAKLKFTKEDFLVYKTIVDAQKVSHSNANKKAVSAGLKKGVFAGEGKEEYAKVSLAPAPLLKSLRFKEQVTEDKENGITHRHEMGITPLDQKKLEENRVWIKLWTSTDQTAAREQYIKDNLPKMFDDFKWPTVEELSNGTALKGERLFEIMDMLRRLKGIEGLVSMSKTAKNICNEPAFAAKLDMLKNLKNYITANLRLKRNIDIDPENADGVRLYTRRFMSETELNGVVNRYLKEYEEKLRLLPKDIFLKKTVEVKKPEKEEEKKENLNKINIIKEEKKENLNKINIINEEKKDSKNTIDEDRKTIKDALKKSHDAFVSFKDYPEYLSLIKEANKYLFDGLAGITVDRAVMHMLKFVNFNKKGEPISKTDKENHEWNKKWLKTWHGMNGDFDTMGKMIQENMPHAYDGVDSLPPLPKMQVDLAGLDKKEKENVIKEYRLQLDEWCEKIIKEDKLKMILFTGRNGISTDNLKNKIPGIIDYINEEKNPKYAALGNTLGSAVQYLQLYVPQKHKMNLNSADLKKAPNNEFLLDFYAEKLYESSILYDQHKNDKDMAFDVSKMKTMEAEFQKDKEFLQFKEQVPEFTRIGYDVLKRFERVKNMGNRPQYTAAYDKAEPTLSKYMGSGLSFDRSVSLIIKPVIYGKDGSPTNKEMAENEAWNMKWLKAWEDDDYDTREKMISEYYPNIYDAVSDIPIPTAEQVKKPNLYADVINLWIEKKVHGDSNNFFSAIRRDLAFNVINKAHPSLANHIKSDKRFAALNQAVNCLSLYATSYLTKQYNVNLIDGRDRVVDNKSTQVAMANMTIPDMLKELTAAAAKYGKLKDKKPVPYKKMKK